MALILVRKTEIHVKDNVLKFAEGVNNLAGQSFKLMELMCLFEKLEGHKCH